VCIHNDALRFLCETFIQQVLKERSDRKGFFELPLRDTFDFGTKIIRAFTYFAEFFMIVFTKIIRAFICLAEFFMICLHTLHHHPYSNKIVDSVCGGDHKMR